MPVQIRTVDKQEIIIFDDEMSLKDFVAEYVEGKDQLDLLEYNEDKRTTSPIVTMSKHVVSIKQIPERLPKQKADRANF